ncbi:MAG: type II toxin-antitoxin system VapC family toxin [Promethearchaeota archaeon]
MQLYLDTNIFYHAYCPVEKGSIIDWLFDKFSTEFQGVTSEWAIVEMFRALKKQVNLGNIEEKDANLTLDFFLVDIGQMVQDEKIILKPVSFKLIMAARELIFTYNLYSADALHGITAIRSNVDAFISTDSDFKNYLGSIPIINPLETNFKEKITSFFDGPED